MRQRIRYSLQAYYSLSETEVQIRFTGLLYTKRDTGAVHVILLHYLNCTEMYIKSKPHKVLLFS